MCNSHFPFLLKVASKSRGKRSTDQKRSKKNNSFLPVEDVTQDDLDNVADRPCDKILDKENVRTAIPRTIPRPLIVACLFSLI